MINYTPTRVEPKISSDNVHSWVFGITGTDSETGTSAYFDSVWKVTEKALASWTKADIDAEIATCKTENDMEAIIAKKILAKDSKTTVNFDYNSL